ncbi:MAG TPA: hypothetical protein VHP37_28055 [Burkholderiales bacterium]|nr:hypothetical protein [Burkholderiales bacterium]
MSQPPAYELPSDEEHARRLQIGCLRRHAGYRKCCEAEKTGEAPVGPYAKTLHSFGDVCSQTDDEAMQALRRMFWQPRMHGAFEVHTLEEWRDHAGSPDSYVVVLNRYAPLKLVLEDVEKIFKQRGELTRGRPKADYTGQTYPFFARPNCDVIKTRLDVFDLSWRRLADPLWKICEVAQLSPALDAGHEADRMKMEEEAGRYLREAEAMIENAARGVFPKYTLAPGLESHVYFAEHPDPPTRHALRQVLNARLAG